MGLINNPKGEVGMGMINKEDIVLKNIRIILKLFSKSIFKIIICKNLYQKNVFQKTNSKKNFS